MPLGSAAQNGNPACDGDIESTAGAPWINASKFSIPIYSAASTDPSVPIYVGGTQWSSAKTPATAQPSNDTDHHLSLIDPTHRYSVDLEGADRTLWPMKMTAWTVGEFDLYGDGITPLSGAGYTSSGRAYGGSAIAGLMRTGELQAGSIQHALALAIETSLMQRGPVWPASSEDAPSISSTYGGHVPMGTLVALPPSVDVNALGLTSVGLEIAHALQTYGAYVVDTADAFTLYADPGADSLVAPARAANDLGKLRPYLRCVSNNGPNSVGGGGTPVAPLAPPLG